MSWLKKVFGQKDGTGTGPGSPEPDDDEADADPSVRNAPRREVVQVVLRDTMRRHGIPSDWIESRILAVESASKGPSLHVLLVVRQGEDRLVTYVHAFQQSFMEELLKFEPRARDWVSSLSWQFEGNPRKGAMPDPSSWQPGRAAAAAADSEPPDTVVPEDAVDSELEQDLKQLFAIRDAAMKPGNKDGSAQEEPRPDFEPTRPGFDEDSEPPAQRTAR